MTDQNNDSSTTVKKITKTRKQMEEEIERVASQETDSKDNYTCPYCYSHQPKNHVDIHKKECPEIWN